MADMPATGRLDYFTLMKMKQPRCGIKDIFLREDGTPSAADARLTSAKRSERESTKLRQSLGGNVAILDNSSKNPQIL